MDKSAGFTLMETLVALAVIAIALAAIMRAISSQIDLQQRLYDKTASHLVCLQGAAMIKLGLIELPNGQDITEQSDMLGTHWYWRAHKEQSSLPNIEKITIMVASKVTGPFTPMMTIFKPERQRA